MTALGVDLTVTRDRIFADLDSGAAPRTTAGASQEQLRQVTERLDRIEETLREIKEQLAAMREEP